MWTSSSALLLRSHYMLVGDRRLQLLKAATSLLFPSSCSRVGYRRVTTEPLSTSATRTPTKMSLSHMNMEPLRLTPSYPRSRFRLNVSAGSQKTSIHSEPEGTSLVFSGCANFSRTWVFLLHGCQYIEETRRTRLLLSKDTVTIGTVLGQTNKRVPLSLCLKRLLGGSWGWVRRLYGLLKHVNDKNIQRELIRECLMNDCYAATWQHQLGCGRHFITHGLLLLPPGWYQVLHHAWLVHGGQWTINLSISSISNVDHFSKPRQLDEARGLGVLIALTTMRQRWDNNDDNDDCDDHDIYDRYNDDNSSGHVMAAAIIRGRRVDSRTL